MAREEENKPRSNRGFASMDRAKQRAIASKGGQSVPPEKRSFSQNPGLAAQAGRKGGESVPPEGRSFSQNRELAAEAGRKGGQARGAASQRRRQGGEQEARRQGETFHNNREMGAEGARNPGQQSGGRHVSSVDIPSDTTYGDVYGERKQNTEEGDRDEGGRSDSTGKEHSQQR